MATPLEVKNKYQLQLMQVPGVTGIGATSDRILVYVVDESVMQSIPNNLDGVPVQIIVSGRVSPLG